MAHLTLIEAAAALRAGTVTSVGLVEAALAAADRWDETLGIYLTRMDEDALAAARRADRELAAGHDRGPLHGIPFGIKDLIAVAGVPTTAQSLVRRPEWGPGRAATVVERLMAAGAVITGKTSTMEFGCGLPDPAKPFPVPRNPWDPRRWAGGSSSGSACGVAAGAFLAGLGTDTAGSIRMPAAFCGVTGLAPTFGRVPSSGCLPLGYSLDRVGPLAHGARDCAAVLGVLTDAGPESCTVESGTELTGLRIGVVREHHLPPAADPALAEVFERAVAVLAELGATVTEVALPYWAEAITATMVVASAEGLAYHRTDLTERWTDYTPAARGLLATGALVSAADYVQAQRMRSLVSAAVTELFSRVDVIVTPTAAVAAPLLRELADESGHQDSEGVFGMLFTPYWNSVPNPVLSIPMGRNADELPLAMQIAAPCFDDATALRVGAAFQERTDWHRPSSPVSAAEVETVPWVDVSPIGPPEPLESSAGSVAVADRSAIFVGAALHAADLPARGIERTGMIARYPGLRAAVDALSAVPGIRDAVPINRDITRVHRDAVPVVGDVASVHRVAAPICDAAPIASDAGAVHRDAVSIVGDAAPINRDATPTAPSQSGKSA